MPTDEERVEVAKRLRELPIDMYEVEERWEAEGLGTDCHDQTDYFLIHNVLFGCLPAEHMHPCDYEELHARLADLIDPTVETCELELTWGGQTNAHVRTYECTKCGKSCDNVWGEGYEFCPYCGRRIENTDE